MDQVWTWAAPHPQFFPLWHGAAGGTQEAASPLPQPGATSPPGPRLTAVRSSPCRNART